MTRSPIYWIARGLIASVFIGLGAARLLAAAGILDHGTATAGIGAMLLSSFELAAGLMIVFGLQVRWVALTLAAFLLIDAFFAHPFWLYAGADQQAQLLHFLKNFSAIGGLLLLFWVEQLQRSGAKH